MTVIITTAGYMNIRMFAGEKFVGQYGQTFSYLNIALTIALLTCVAIVLVTSVRKWIELYRKGITDDEPLSKYAVPAAS
jgi:carbon starvation protein CstA